jgi:hypothetical protein
VNSRPRRWPKRLVVVILTALAVGLIGLVAARALGIHMSDHPQPASIEKALQRFREARPQPKDLEGVYLYSTAGSESVDALGGSHHRYPKTTSITVLRTSCGIELQWNALAARSTNWTICRTVWGIELRAYDEIHRFFWKTDHTSYTCDPGVLVTPRARAGSLYRFSCRSSSGYQAGTVSMYGDELVDVGSDSLAAIHVSLSGRVHGGERGNEELDWWLDKRSLIPLRIVKTSRTSRDLFVGRVHYKEDVDLQLTSTTPLR